MTPNIERRLAQFTRSKLSRLRKGEARRLHLLLMIYGTACQFSDPKHAHKIAPLFGAKTRDVVRQARSIRAQLRQAARSSRARKLIELLDLWEKAAGS